MTDDCSTFLGVALDIVEHQVPLSMMASSVSYLRARASPDERCGRSWQAASSWWLPGHLYGMFTGIDVLIDLDKLCKRPVYVGNRGVYRIFNGRDQLRTDWRGQLNDGVFKEAAS